MTLTSYWHLSQKDLNLLATCPLQFQQSYWQKLDSLPNLTQAENAEWGKQFHRLMQQYSLGLPLENLLTQQPELNNSFQALIQATDDIWHNPNIQLRTAEYQLKLTDKNYIFTVIYDLLILTKNQAIIYDWKTYLQPPNKQRLENNWQTKLYLYVLAESLNYQPEQISFTYWFVKLPQKPQSYTIKYNQTLHQEIKQELVTLLNQFELIINQYPLDSTQCLSLRNCEECDYSQTLIASNYNGKNDDKLLKNIPLSLAEIPEINITSDRALS